APRWVIAGHAWPDPHATADVVIGDVGDALHRITAALAPRAAHPSWAATWRAADRAAVGAIATALVSLALERDAAELLEPAALRSAISAAPPAAQLVLGNSLPIRLVDALCPGGGPYRRVLSQRGANGIYGLIAGAVGAATLGPTLLVLGDVSFAHDAGALAAARHARAPLAIVVIDNGGGRIFDQLPLAASALPPGEFARLWRTPPALDPVAVAQAFGCRGVCAPSGAALADAVADALERPGTTVIHVPVAAESAAIFRRAALAALAAESPAAGVER
ncbi:MAG: hypothetical protein K8W52_30640, partial [Deltaproteobacteria bacterium]|nr:hypothetical protein [Deltaproteobacteria bacterium]